jgi:hypothetical protein
VGASEGAEDEAEVRWQSDKAREGYRPRYNVRPSLVVLSALVLGLELGNAETEFWGH